MNQLNITYGNELKNGDIVRVVNTEAFCGLPEGIFTLTAVEIENELYFVSNDVYLANWYKETDGFEFMEVEVIIGNVDEAILLFRNE